MPPFETKFLAADVADLALRDEADRAPVVVGYASTFGGPADSYGDVVEPGAYAATVKSWAERPYALPMLVEHDGLPVGKWPLLVEDAKGLRVEGELTPGHSKAADVAASVRHQAVSGLSIGYRVKRAEQLRGGGRRLLEIELREISIVANPANETARIAGIKAAAMTVRDFERLLRGEGFSRRDAELIAEDGFKSWLGARDGRTGRDDGDADPHGDPGRRDDGTPPRDGAGVASVLQALKALRLTPDTHHGRAP